MSLANLDARGQIAAMHPMREYGESLFAIFHSDPTSPAEPSPRDLAEAAYPEALYLITSLNLSGLLVMRGFRLTPDNSFAEVELLLESD
jgi:proteasome lid subunit RPN8/RPN11